MPDPAQAIQAALFERFGERLEIDAGLPGLDELARIAGHRVHRRYQTARGRRRTCCGCSAPARCRRRRRAICSRPTSSSCATRPTRGTIADLHARNAVACARRRCSWCFSPTAAGCRQFARCAASRFPTTISICSSTPRSMPRIVLATFLRAAEAVGLGCCPISVIRDHAADGERHARRCRKRSFRSPACASAGRRRRATSAPRLPLERTVHEERFDEGDLAAQIDAYDRRRAAIRPYRNQRDPARFGARRFYGWSEDKARQYGVPLRADFGAFVRAKGFHLD